MEERFKEAVEAHKDKRYDEAEEAYWLILKEMPDDAHVNYLMGALLLETKQYHDSFVFIQKAIEHDDLKSDYFSCLGQVLYRLNKFPDSVSAFRRAIELDASSYEAHINLANLLNEIGEHDEALSVLQISFKLAPDNPESHVGMGNVFVRQGKFDWAKSAFNSALRLNSDCISGFLGLGLIAINENNLEDAEEHLRKANSLDNSDPETHLHLGLMFFVQKNYAWAEDAFKTVLKINEQHLVGNRWLARVYDAKKDYTNSESLFRRVYLLATEDFRAMTDLGHVCLRSGNYHYAVGMFKGALEQKPESLESLHALGTVLVLMGRYDEAISCLRKALKFELLSDVGMDTEVELISVVVESALGHDRSAPRALSKMSDDEKETLQKMSCMLEQKSSSGLIAISNVGFKLSEVEELARNGDAEAQFKMSLLLYHGYIWNKPDYEASLLYLFKAAESGLVEAQLRMGAMYALGRGTEVDNLEAVEWFQLALNNGSDEAGLYLKHLDAANITKPTAGDPRVNTSATVSDTGYKGPKITLPEGAVAPRPKNLFTGVYWGPADQGKFHGGLQTCINEVAPEGIYSSDNLFTFGRQLGFLSDPDFQAAFNKNVETDVEKGIIWRTHILAWAAENGMRREGDFVECGCYKGVSSKIVCDYLDFGNCDKEFYLYDLFYHEESMEHHCMPEHGDDLYEKTVERFSEMKNVKIVKGMIPESFKEAVPDKIAFLHIDMNEAVAELAALEVLWDKVVPGGLIVLDDYGWGGYYINQKFKEDPFFAARGYKVVELPTGQGLILK